MLVVKCNRMISEEQFDHYVEKFNKQVKENGFIVLPAGFEAEVAEIDSRNLCEDELTIHVDSE